MRVLLQLGLASIAIVMLAGCSGRSADGPSSSSDSNNEDQNNSAGHKAQVHVNLPADPKQFSGWVLEQSNQLLGNQTLYVCPAACRLENPRTDATYILTSSDWKVYCFSGGRKLLYQTGFADLMNARKQQADGDSPAEADSVYHAGGTEVIAGLNATCYTSTAKDKEHPDQPPATTQMWFAQDIDLPANYSDLQMQPAEGLPSRGVLLRMTVTDEGEKTTIFDTISANKLQIPPDKFRPPENYNEAPHETAVTMGEEEAESLDEMYHVPEPSADDKEK